MIKLSEEVTVKTTGYKLHLTSDLSDLRKLYEKGRIKASIIQTMKGGFLVNPKTNEYVVDVAGWWYSEKLDGIRAIWDGEKLWTRHNKLIYAPEWFTKDFPKSVCLDGELYVARGKFHETQSIVMNRHQNESEWKQIKYHVFDIPDNMELKFEEVQSLLASLEHSSNMIEIVKQVKLTSLKELLNIQKEIIELGGEGTMVRRPGSQYEIGLSKNLLKFKCGIENGKIVRLYDDEAIIIGYNYNTKEKGNITMKSLQVQWVSDKSIDFGVSLHIKREEKEAHNYKELFPIGEKIKVFYSELFPSGKPRFPRYGGLKSDE